MTENGARVLLVTDDPFALRALEDVYRGAGMLIYVVQDPRSALGEASRVNPDLCVVDVVEGSGIQLMELLRRRAEMRRSALIGVTAVRDQTYLLSSFAAGADDFLFKPLEPQELLVRSRLAIQRRRAGASGESTGTARLDLTALFCDVRGFTSVSSSLDPESVVEMLNGVFEKLVHHVTSWGGQVDKFLGDGLLAFFGMSHGAGAELCAIKAALSMVHAMHEYSQESLTLGGRPLGVGVGIACGEVVVASVGAQQIKQVTVIGDAVNLASRLQSIAGEGEVLICERTYGRVADAVVTGGAREVALKGVTGNPIVHRVQGLSQS